MFRLNRERPKNSSDEAQVYDRIETGGDTRPAFTVSSQMPRLRAATSKLKAIMGRKKAAKATRAAREKKDQMEPNQVSKEAPKQIASSSEDSEADRLPGFPRALITGEFSIKDDGMARDVFGIIPDDNSIGEHPYSINIEPFISEAITRSPAVVAHLRSSANPRKAIADYCVWRWVMETRSEEPIDDTNSDGTENLRKDHSIRTPKLKIHLGLRDQPGESPQVFAFTSIAGTSVIVGWPCSSTSMPIGDLHRFYPDDGRKERI